MKGYVFCSLRQGAGKTTVITGLARALGKEKTGYFKPLGDRLVYKNKVLWDLDGALMKEVLESEFSSSDLTYGFDHSKLRYMHGKEDMVARLKERCDKLSQGKEHFFVEATGALESGHSLNIDAISLSLATGFPLVGVLRGDNSTILDDASFLKGVSASQGVDLFGVVVNNVHDITDIEEVVVPELKEMEVPLLGTISHKQKLDMLSVAFIMEQLFAKVIAGENGLTRTVSQIFVGAMAASHARRHPGWRDPNKLIITAGDRDDLIAAAVEDGAACIVITNDLVPSPSIIAKADQKGVPILQVPTDTYSTARKLETIDSVTLPCETEKMEVAEELVTTSGLIKHFDK